MIRKSDYLIFDCADSFKKGRAIVNQGEYWGEINHKGEWVTRIKCEEFTRINNNLIRIKINEKYGCINNTGKWIIEPLYDLMYWDTMTEYFIVEKNGVFGTLSFKNKLIIDLKYKLLVIAAYKGKYISAYDGKNFGLLDKFGKIILPFKYDLAPSVVHNHFAFCNYNNSWTAINLKTKKSVKFDCLDWRCLSSTTVAILKKSNKWVLVDYNNTKICDTEFDDIDTGNFRIELIKARIGDYYGFIDKNGKTVIDFKYKDTEYFSPLQDCKFIFNKSFCPVTLDGKKWGLINQDGKEVIPYEYDRLTLWYKKYLIVQKNGKTGVIDWNEKTIIDFIYDKIDDSTCVKENYIVFGLNVKYGFVRMDGKPLKISRESLHRTELTISQILPNSSLVKDLILDVYEKIEENQNKNLGIQTRFVELDSILGGVQEANLIVIAARPGVGKTTLAVNLALNVTQSHIPVAIFTTEQSKKDLTLLLLSILGGIDIGRLNTGGMQSKDWENLAVAMNQLSTTPLYINSFTTYTISDICSEIKNLKEVNENLRLVIIDDIHLYENRIEANYINRGLSITQILKNLAIELNISIIITSQLLRKLEYRKNKHPLISDLPNDSINVDADVIIFIYRDSYYKVEACKDYDVAEIIIAKNKNGAIGTVPLCFKGKYRRFETLSMIEQMKYLFS